MSGLEIIPVEYGDSVLPESMIFQNGAEDKFRPIVFMVYLIKAENKMILVDAGCVTMPGFDMHNFIGPVKALENMGVSAEDITDVIITHAHHDHIECVSEFKNAKIHIQEDEYEDGKHYFKDGMNVNLFENEAYVLPNVKAVKIGGHSKGSCVVEITDNDKNNDKISVIAGDECYSYACLNERIPTGSSYCLEKSKEFIDRYRYEKYNVLLCHEK